MLQQFRRGSGRRAGALLACFFALLSEVNAAVPTTLFSGSTAFAFSGGGNAWCSIEPGISMFQKGGTSPRLRISFPEITYFNGSVYYSYSGQAVLLRGQALFDHPSNALDTPPTVTNYISRYSTRTGILRVQFTLNFPTCSLNISSTYRS